MSLTLLEQLKSSITPQLTSYAAKLTGETPAAIDRAISAALPTILSGIGSATRLPSGLSVVHRLVSDPVNDGTLLHQLPALYQGTMSSAPVYRLGTQLLQAIFGNKLSQVTQTIAVLCGVKPTASALLVSTLAPHVLSVIGERQRAGLVSTSASLVGLLDGESAGIAAALPPSLGQIFGAPVVARAAAGAASAATAAGLSTVAAHAGHAGVTSKAGAPIVRRVAQSAGGPPPWIIFPVGLIFGTGLVGLGSLMSTWSHDRAPAVIAAAPAPVKAPTAPAKSAEVKPAPAPVPPVAKPAAKALDAKPTAKTAEKPVDAKPAPAPKVGEAAPVKTSKPEPGATAPAPVKAQPLPAGVTNYYGSSPAPQEAPARPNPDYKPADVALVAVEAATVVAATVTSPPNVPVIEAPLPVGPAGVTSFFGDGKPVVEMAAVSNPDYKPAKPSPPPAPAVAEAPPRAPSPPGVTTFFGSNPGSAERPAIPNPDYKPTAAIAAAPVPVAPLAPSMAAASPAGVDICRTAVAAAAASGTVLFKSARADLKTSSVATLDRIAQAFKSCPNARLRIEGHTDDTGLAEMNQKLSEARAQTVSRYLAAQGIDVTHISSAGFGPSRPLVPNSNATNKALNRRIAFVVDAM